MKIQTSWKYDFPNLVLVDNYNIVIYHVIVCKYNIKIILNSQSWDLNFFMAMNTKISHKLSHNIC